MSMPKVYFCSNLLEGLSPSICGETDPENFHPGRYSRCKKCRNISNRDSYKRAKEKTTTEQIEERIEDLKEGKKIQALIVANIEERPLKEEGITITDSFYFIKNNIKNNYDILYTLIKELQDKNKKSDSEITYLKNENEKLKRKIDEIENFLGKDD
jgi:hypothetical protein